MNNPLRVLLIHDHQVREGIRHCLEQEPDIELVGEASSAKEALLRVEQTHPGMVTLNLHLPEMLGVDLAQWLRRRWPDLKILLLSGYDSEKSQFVQGVVRVGAQGYLLKDTLQEHLVQAIYAMVAGGTVLDPAVLPLLSFW